ncbi:MAG TPA: type I 3-dehydroquinate dehydratase, partial [Blastocatellia bacterium]|nr:type I 3-dehydroquinate dehydratase [Blastocatellia bacterium]
MPERSPSICAVIAESSTIACLAAIKQAAGSADLIEVRLDYLRDFDFSNPELLRPLLENKPLPVIITCRSVPEGGQQHVDEAIRLRLLVAGARQLADYCDIEAASYPEAVKRQPDFSRLIVSYHNFDETPANLKAIYERVNKLPASIHKIVSRANSVSDSLAVLGLLDEARAEGRNLIAMAMGEDGLLTRVLGPAHGSFLTYGSLGAGRESAPGQITCDDLKSLYRVSDLSLETRITGIIGNPVAHSASPAMHNAAFKALGLDFVYLPIRVDNLTDFFARFVKPATREIQWNLRGLSVTIPHKTAVIETLDRFDETAGTIGAVNTLVVSNRELLGYNTDVRGAVAPLERLGNLQGESCAVIGAGGAARAVVHGLLDRGATVTIFARDAAKAKSLGEKLPVRVAAIEELESSDAAIVINTTPVGMRGHSEGSSPVDRRALRNRRIAYDLVYNPIETRFLRDASEEG